MISNLCELIGMAAITVGTWLAAGLAAGLIVGGVLIIIIALGLDRGRG